MYDGGEHRSGLGRDPNLVGLLSLQLLLLAFFILLVSMSSFDVERVRSVLGSVQAAFAETSDTDSSDEHQRADAVTLAKIVDDIEGVLATSLRLDRIERIGDGAVVFEMAADSLFAANASQLAPGRADIPERIVAALDARPAGYRYEVELLVGRTTAAPGMADGLPGLEIERAGVLARAMREAGALESGLAAGLLPDAPGRLRILIDLTDRPRAGGLFAAGVPAGDGAAEADRGGGR